MKLIIISNRLPVKIVRNGDRFRSVRSEGGLATGLSSLETSMEMHWVGWPGIHTEDKKEQKKIRKQLKKRLFHPIFLSSEQINDYYEGYSNSTIWPLCHYFFAYMEYESRYWQAYKEVNALFCEAAVKLMEPGDIVWVQDYQLMLLPSMIRDKIQDASIGYFHHIPFPAYELFRVLPERAEILNGLLGADLIAFHTYDYMRHFISAAYRVLDMDCYLDEIRINNRVIHIDAYPMGINFSLYYDAILRSSVQKTAAKLSKDFGNHKFILSVDRLDYSKGILHRLKGFANFLKNHPEYIEKVSLLMVIVPSRDNVEIYADLKTKIDEAIGAINGKYSSINWVPVYYFYRGFSFEELTALYHIADVALVTPLRDGMNLVAKEYLAAKRDKPGVLILSEMTGASIELSDAIIINPNDANDIEEAILKSIEMTEKEQLEKLSKMQKIISKQTINKWAKDFVYGLQDIKKRNNFLSNKFIKNEAINIIRYAYDNAEKRLIILDYDGTLATFKKNPNDAAPTSETMNILHKLTDDIKNKVVISSGRDYQTLETWFGGLPVGLAAEHGAFYKEDSIWHENIHDFQWSDEITDIIQQVVDKTPGSMIELKKTSIVWHYRKADAWLANLRESQLIDALINPCSRLNLQIMKGSKMVEVKSPNYNKGSEVKRLIGKENYDFIIAMGDDITDEDTFNSLPSNAITIKVGAISESARCALRSQSEVIPFLNKLTEN